MTFNILSLDGGGPWALIEALALADLFPGETGHQILGRFGLAIGNSGGSIVLAGLVKNLTPQAICDLFLVEANRSRIFQRTSLLGYFIDKTLGLGPKWDTEAKFEGLSALLDADPGARIARMKMSALPGLVKASTGKDIAIIIPGFEYDLNREIFFGSTADTFSNANLGGFEPTLAGAVHASSNAPVNYFNAPALVASCNGGPPRRFWDGAIGGFNNPVLQGVMEAMAMGHAAGDIVALSLGTATIWQPVGKPAHGESRELFRAAADTSTLSDITKMAESILDDPPDAASMGAHIVTGAPAQPRIVRFNPAVSPTWTEAGWILPPGFAQFADPHHPPHTIDAMDAFKTLRDMAMDETDQDKVAMLARLAQLWIGDAIPNQPIRRDHLTGACLIGHDTYSAAKVAAQALIP